jgi:hypothetical protein
MKYLVSRESDSDLLVAYVKYMKISSWFIGWMIWYKNINDSLRKIYIIMSPSPDIIVTVLIFEKFRSWNFHDFDIIKFVYRVYTVRVSSVLDILMDILSCWLCSYSLSLKPRSLRDKIKHQNRWNIENLNSRGFWV